MSSLSAALSYRTHTHSLQAAPHCRVFARTQDDVIPEVLETVIPPTMNYGPATRASANRISPVLAVVDMHFELTTRERRDGQHWLMKGNHGFATPLGGDMSAVFAATGPAFRHAGEFPALENVDVKSLVLAALGVLPPRALAPHLRFLMEG